MILHAPFQCSPTTPRVVFNTCRVHATPYLAFPLASYLWPQHQKAIMQSPHLHSNMAFLPHERGVFGSEAVRHAPRTTIREAHRQQLHCRRPSQPSPPSPPHDRASEVVLQARRPRRVPRRSDGFHTRCFPCGRVRATTGVDYFNVTRNDGQEKQ